MEELHSRKQMDQHHWPETKARIAARFAEKPLQDWIAIFEGTDACVTPVLTLAEAAEHPHNVARQNIVRREGIRQPGVSPVFDRSPGAIRGSPPRNGQDGETILTELGLSSAEIDALVQDGVVRRSAD